MKDISRERLEKLLDIMTDIALEYGGAELTEKLLRSAGFSDSELGAIGFDTEVLV